LRCPDGTFTLDAPIVLARIYASVKMRSMSIFNAEPSKQVASAAGSIRWDARDKKRTRQLIVSGQEVGDRVIEIEPYPSLGEQVIQVSTLDEADTLVLFQ
jgi:hypothetical protein